MKKFIVFIIVILSLNFLLVVAVGKPLNMFDIFHVFLMWIILYGLPLYFHSLYVNADFHHLQWKRKFTTINKY